MFGMFGSSGPEAVERVDRTTVMLNCRIARSAEPISKRPEEQIDFVVQGCYPENCMPQARCCVCCVGNCLWRPATQGVSRYAGMVFR
jgi:hypothetical protein